MALELVVAKDSITSDCTTVTIVDSTGNYNNPDNLTGYGTPNEERSNLYLKLLVTLKKSTGDERIDVPAYNENTAASWQVTITEGGYYELFLFGCLAWDTGTTFALNYITYDTGQDKFYKSLQAGNTNNVVTDTDWWEEATEVEDFLAAVNLSQPDTYYDITSYIEYCQAVVCKNEAILLEADCSCVDKCIVKDYEKLRTYIEAAQIKEGSDDYTGAQVIMERVQEICDNLPNCGCK